MSYPLKERTAVCVDCKREFRTKTWNAKRCHDCKKWNGKPVKQQPAKERT